MSDMTIEQFCNKHNACKEGHDWAIENFASIQDAWDNATDYEYALWTVTRPGVLTYCELRLFACWCARQVWDLLTDERSRKAVEVAERFANGNATADELITANDAARAAARAAAKAAGWAAAGAAASDAAWGAARAAAWGAAGAAAVAAQLDYLRKNTAPNFLAS